jgi:hypothetical protein
MKQNVTQIFYTTKFGTYNLITLTWQKYYLKNTRLINFTLSLWFPPSVCRRWKFGQDSVTTLNSATPRFSAKVSISCFS